MNELKQLSISDIHEVSTENSEEFCYAKICVLSTKPNSHKVLITDEILRRDGISVRGKWIVCDFNGFDATTHTAQEKIVGIVPHDAKIDFVEEDGYTSMYVDAIISKIYAKEIYDMFKIHNFRNVSVEMMTNDENDYVHLEFSAPTRGLIGYRSAFITNTKGEGVMVRSFDSYKPYVGELSGRKNGVLVSMENGKTLGFSLFNLQDRGTLIIGPAEEVYVGMVVGINNRDNDLNVNPCKNKQLTNTRASGSDEAIALIKPKTFSLEEALEFIEKYKG